MRRKLLLGTTGLAGLIVLGVAAWALWPRGTDQITASEAVQSYRNHTSSTIGITGSSSTPTGTVRPTPGVYRYLAEGTETVKFGPLPAEDRTLPASVTGVITSADKGCFTFTLNLFVQHTEDSVFCGTTGRLDMTSYAKHETIGALTATAAISCDPGVFIGPAGPNHHLKCLMSLKGGPFPVKAEFTGTARVAKPQTLDVGGKTLRVTPVTVSFTFATAVKGSWTEKIWFSDDRLPVRIERALDMTGPAKFDERFTLALASPTPTT